MQVSPKDVTQVAWWLIWLGIISSILVLHFVIPTPVAAPASGNALLYLPVFPLLLGMAVRWLLLPRLTKKEHALSAFVMGLALCESCGILGIFLAPEQRATYVLLALLGVVQFLPVFAGKFNILPQSR